MFAIELGQRVTTRLELRQRGLRLPASGPGTHLLLLQRRDVPARVLQRFDGPNRGMRVPRDALRGRFRLACRFMCGGFAVLPLCGRQRQLLAQLTPLPVERGSLELEGTGAVRPALQPLFQFAHSRALGGEPAAHVVFVARARAQLALHGREVALRSRALDFGGVMLSQRTRRALFGVGAFFRGGLPALRRVAEPLCREGEITLQPADLELGITEPPLHFGTARFGGMAGLDARFALMFGIAQSSAGGGQRLGELLCPYSERAEREIEVFELPPHERHRDAKTLLDHLAVALGAAALPRQAAHLRLHLGDQILEPREIGGRFFETTLGAFLAIAIQPDAGGFLEQRAPLFGFLRKQRLDHFRFHHDAGIGTKAGAAQHVLNVAQSHGGTIQQIIALTGA